MGAKSGTKRRSTGIIATPILMDTLKATLDNLVNAGFVVRAGNTHAGFAVHVDSVHQCGICAKFVPAQFMTDTGCVNCQPEAFEVATSGTEEAQP